MTDLLLHPQTVDRIAAVLHHPPQGLLITGEIGSGKDTLSRRLAADLLGIAPEKLGSYPYLYILDPAEETIKIEAIRELQSFLKLRVPAEKPGLHRIVIIARAERMRKEAQNALLKTLEEPPADTVIILTASSSERLLSTIVSRTQELAVLPVSLAQAKEYFGQKGIPEAKLVPAYALSMGQVGLLSALLEGESHPLKEQVAAAKSILAEPIGKRLIRVDACAKDKATLRLLLNALQRIAHAGLVAASQQGKQTTIKQWHGRQAAILQAVEDIGHNSNTKLLLTDLFIRL